MENKSIYNLEFPTGVRQLNICNYVFDAVSNYDEAYGLMPNYSVTQITGSHQITATVSIPDTEAKATLIFENAALTKLHDILFFLSIFTGRNVFAKDWNGEEPIIEDYRPHTAFGGQLRLSINLNSKFKVKATGEIIDPETANGIPIWDMEWVSSGFDAAIEKVIEHVSTNKWRDIYDDGYFLILYRDMIRWQIIEKSFLTAWTIWESLFSIENREWLSDKDLKDTKSEVKISYVLYKYLGISLNNKQRNNVRLLVNARNRLVHFGKMSTAVKTPEMKMFIQTTDQIIAIILGLVPNNTLNSREHLNTFLNTGRIEGTKLRLVSRNEAF